MRPGQTTQQRNEAMTDPANAGMLEQLLTSNQIAASFAMPRSTVEDYARRGILPSIKIGRHRRFVRDRVEEALRRLTDGDDPQAG